MHKLLWPQGILLMQPSYTVLLRNEKMEDNYTMSNMLLGSMSYLYSYGTVLPKLLFCSFKADPQTKTNSHQWEKKKHIMGYFISVVYTWWLVGNSVLILCSCHRLSFYQRKNPQSENIHSCYFLCCWINMPAKMITWKWNQLLDLKLC